MKTNWLNMGCAMLGVLLVSAQIAAAHGDDKKKAKESHAASQATTYTCPMHPEVVSDKPGDCPKCGMALKPKGHGHAEPTMKASYATAEPLQVGNKADVIVRFSKQDGSPVLLSDLKTAHTEKIHLLIIDTSLTDYHHEHPVPGDKDGEYKFSFTPKKPGPYRVWADLHPMKTDVQEYVVADIAATTEGEPLTDRSITNVAVVDGLTYTITWENPTIEKGKPVMGKLRITDADGKPFNQLEPVMGAFAHIVGFAEDFKTVVHIHPMGREPEDASERGGPELDFHLVPEGSGFIRLFAQVQIDEKAKFAPFGLNVVSAQAMNKSLKGADHGHDHGHAHDHGHGHGDQNVHAVGSLSEAWQEIKKHQEQLHAAIAANELGQVHGIAFSIRDLANQLPKLSSDLPADSMKKLNSWLPGVADSAKKLDQYGDAGDKANTQKEAKRMNTLISALEKLYGPKSEDAAATTYTCPMHPEVVQNGPGKCPKCGMNLEPKKE
jgi:rubrerythrin